MADEAVIIDSMDLGVNLLDELVVADTGSPGDSGSEAPREPGSSGTESCASLDSTKFDDGLRNIDMVLVYDDDMDPVRADKRTTFENNLRYDGLQMEKAKSTKDSSRLVFIKIHASNHMLAEYADVHDMKVGFTELEESSADYPRLLGMMSTSPGVRTLRANFREEDIEGKIAAEGAIFTSAERSSVVHSMLRNTPYGEDENAVGLPRLLTERVYTEAYPLHDGKHNVVPPPEFTPNDRRLLYTTWSSPLAFYRKQPLDLVNKYFGDEVALYFAWLGCYTTMLVPASVLGVCITFVSFVLETSEYDQTSEEICNTFYQEDLIVCPRCSLAFCQESVVFLSSYCFQSRFSYLMDNYATIFNAFCMAFWATAYGEVWKRQLTILQWRWDLQSAEIDYDLRPEFLEAVKTMRYNPILKKPVPYLPWWSKTLRMTLSTIGVVVMMTLALSTFVFIVLFKLVLKGFLQEHKWNQQLSRIITVLAGPITSVTLMTILGTIFQPLSFVLTDFEMPRTQAAYEKSRTFKVFAFSFVNSYSLLIYLAFFKGKLYTYPGDSSLRALGGILDLGNDQCEASGCIFEVIVQLFVTLIFKQGLANVGEVLKPQIMIWWRRWRWIRKNSYYARKKRLPRWEEEFQLRQVNIFTLSAEVQEMVIQYGFTILFVAVFPLAPLFALLNNIAEIRVDANKLLVQSRRSIARKVSNLGAWESLMKFITFVAILTNGLLIAFTSESIPETMHVWDYDLGASAYIEEKFSYYPVAELPQFAEALHKIKGHENDTYCRYQGMRRPPWHKEAYEFRYNHWKYLSYKLGIVVFFVLIVLAATAVFSYVFPDIPWLVKEQMMFEKDEAIKAKKTLQKEHDEKYGRFTKPLGLVRSGFTSDEISSVSERRCTPYFPSDTDLGAQLLQGFLPPEMWAMEEGGGGTPPRGRPRKSISDASLDSELEWPRDHSPLVSSIDSREDPSRPDTPPLHATLSEEDEPLLRATPSTEDNPPPPATPSEEDEQSLRFTPSEEGKPPLPATPSEEGKPQLGFTPSEEGNPPPPATPSEEGKPPLPATPSEEGNPPPPATPSEEGKPQLGFTPNKKRKQLRFTSRELRFTPSEEGKPQPHGSTSREGKPQLRGSTSREGKPQLRGSTSREGKPQIRGSTSSEGKPQIRGSTSREGKPQLRGSTSREGKPQIRGSTSSEGKPQLRGSTSREGKPQLRGSTSREGKPQIRGSTSSEGKPQIRGSTSSEGKPQLRGSTSREGKPQIRGSTSREGKPQIRGSTSREGKPQIRGSTSREGKPQLHTTLSREGKPPPPVTPSTEAKPPPPITPIREGDSLNSPSRVKRRNQRNSTEGEQGSGRPPQPDNPFLARWV